MEEDGRIGPSQGLAGNREAVHVQRIRDLQHLSVLVIGVKIQSIWLSCTA